MGNIWAIARHTFAQCLRMRVAIMFIVLLALMLAALPARMEGDGTLAGKIRSFLSYGLSATQMLLILVTIFTTASVVTSDVRIKQIFTIATKPITRSQYILGRWVGVVLLNVVLLGTAGGIIYAVAQYLRAERAFNAQDVQAIETEVFAARHRLWPDPAPIDQNVEKRISEMEADGRLARAIDEFAASTGGDQEAALELFRKEIRKQETEKFQSVAPGATRQWHFTGIRTTGRRVSTEGVVHEFVAPAARIRVDGKVIGQLVSSGPVKVEGIAAQVVALGRNFFEVRFDEQELEREGSGKIQPGQSVEILIDPAIQLSYKITPSATNVPGNVLKSRWAFVNTTDRNIRFVEPSRDDPPRMATSMTVPAAVVGSDGTLEVLYQNLPNPASNFATTVRIPAEEISLLYRAGGFGGNYVRAVAMILLQLMFIAAVAVFAGSFSTFPVACLICFSVLPFALAGDFMNEALSLSRGPQPELATVIGHYILQGMRFALPDMSGMSPGRWLVDGIYIPWGWPLDIAAATAEAAPPGLLPAIGMTLLVRTLIVLALACLIFQRRELAKVQA